MSLDDEKDLDEVPNETTTKSTFATTKLPLESSLAEEIGQSEETPEENDQPSEENMDDESEIPKDIETIEETTDIGKTNEFMNPTMDTDVQKPLAVS